jgi:hypothetical protein
VGVAVGLLLLVASPAAALLPSSWGNGWSGWDVVAARAEQWEERLENGQGTEGHMFFFSEGANETAELDYWLRLRHDESSPLEPVLADHVLGGGGGLAFGLWQPREAVAGLDAVAVVTRDREPDVAAFLGKLRQSFDDVELAEVIDVRSFGVPVQQATIWTCRNYRPPP